MVSDQKFLQMLNAAAEDPRMSDAVGGLIAYANSEQSVDCRILDSSLRYTTEALFRLGFSLPITSPDYLKKDDRCPEWSGNVLISSGIQNQIRREKR
ncbi:MAG: hypothetical protein V8R75_15210 [Oscillospiraceae bacterium]